MSNDHVLGDPPPAALAEEFVSVTVPVHIDDLASFHAAVAKWASTASGGKGRVRVS